MSTIGVLLRASAVIATAFAAHIAELRKRATGADAKLKRLYDAIENGVADLFDPFGRSWHYFAFRNLAKALQAIRGQQL